MKREKLRSNNHAVFKLIYHLVLIVKYRKQVIDEEIKESIIATFIEYAIRHNIELQKQK